MEASSSRSASIELGLSAVLKLELMLLLGSDEAAPLGEMLCGEVGEVLVRVGADKPAERCWLLRTAVASMPLPA